jgi:hypothetical protein
MANTYAITVMLDNNQILYKIGFEHENTIITYRFKQEFYRIWDKLIVRFNIKEYK